MNADTYLRLSEECESIAEQVKPTAEDDQYADARNLAIYYLRFARRELAELSKAIGREQA